MSEELTVISEDDLRLRSQKLNEAQELYEELSYLHNPKMPCPECSGSGAVYGGSLGNICVRCMGARVLDKPGFEPLVLPPFATLRRALTAYADGTPDPSLVPTMADIEELLTKGKEQAKQLQGADPHKDLVLAEPEEAQGLLSEEGGLDDFSDGQLDELEAEDEAVHETVHVVGGLPERQEHNTTYVLHGTVNGLEHLGNGLDVGDRVARERMARIEDPRSREDMAIGHSPTSAGRQSPEAEYAERERADRGGMVLGGGQNTGTVGLDALEAENRDLRAMQKEIEAENSAFRDALKAENEALKAENKALRDAEEDETKDYLPFSAMIFNEAEGWAQYGVFDTFQEAQTAAKGLEFTYGWTTGVADTKTVLCMEIPIMTLPPLPAEDENKVLRDKELLSDGGKD